MNETDSSNKSLAVPAEIDLNGGTLPGVLDRRTALSTPGTGDNSASDGRSLGL